MVDKTFNAGAKIELATVDRSDYQYLYQDGEDFVFMDSQSGEQITVQGDKVGDDSRWLSDGMNVDIVLFKGVPIGVTVPNSVVLQIVVFSVLFGFALAMLPDAKRRPMLSFAESLAGRGFQVVARESVADERPQIEAALRALAKPGDPFPTCAQIDAAGRGLDRAIGTGPKRIAWARTRSTIGPDPRMRTRRRSVRLGIEHVLQGLVE